MPSSLSIHLRRHFACDIVPQQKSFATRVSGLRILLHISQIESWRVAVTNSERKAEDGSLHSQSYGEAF